MHSLYFCYDSWIIRHNWFRVVVVVAVVVAAVVVVVVVAVITCDVDFLYLFLFCSFSTSNGGTNMYAKQFVNRSGNKEKNKTHNSYPVCCCCCCWCCCCCCCCCCFSSFYSVVSGSSSHPDFFCGFGPPAGLAMMISSTFKTVEAALVANFSP